MIAATSARNFAERCGGQFISGANTDVMLTGIAIDSRQVKPGDLFVAIQGERVDGHDFVASAADVGAVAALVSKPVVHELPQILHGDIQSAVAEFGALSREAFNGNVIGITGSAGKTTAKNLIAAVLAEAGEVVATEGNQNNELGVPMTLARLNPANEFAVIEMGAGKPGDIEWLQNIVRPSIGMLLNVTAAHLEHYPSIDEIADTKSAILAQLPEHGVAIFNGDEPWCDAWRARAGSARVITFGFSDRVDVGVLDVSYDGFSGSYLKVRTPVGEWKLTLNIPGRQGVMNALAAIAVAVALGISHAAAARGLEKVRPAVGRGQQFFLAEDITLVDDSYNANPLSVKAAIDVLASSKGPRYLILGAMLELGSETPRFHAEIGRYAAEKGIDALWIVGEIPRPALGTFGIGGLAFASNEALLEKHPPIERGATVLIKASRGARLDVLVEAIVTRMGV